MVTPLQMKALIFLGIVFVGYSFITERGFLGNEEIHVITVVDKNREIIYDSGWIQWFVDDNRNEYNINKKMFDMIQPGHTYRIKTGKRSILSGRWCAYYMEDLGDGDRPYIVTGKQSSFGSHWHAQFAEDLGEEDKP